MKLYKKNSFILIFPIINFLSADNEDKERVGMFYT
jgi:hypothetical protein